VIPTDGRREWVIYALRDPRTKRVRYVGWTVDLARRVRVHLSRSRTEVTYKGHWLAELVSMGLEPIAEVVERGAGDWSDAERRWVKHFRDLGEPLTNSTDGGDGTLGFIPTAETRMRMSRAHLGRRQRPESVEKTRAALLGRKQSPDHLAALSAVRKGRTPVAATLAAATANRGRSQSAEYVAKRIAPLIGRAKPGFRRLTAAAVKEIRAARGLISQRALAARFGVGPTAIFEVQHGATYRDLFADREASP